MIRAIIVDDEEPARDELAYLLEQTGRVRLEGALGSGGEALEMLGHREIDVVFLDIQMPGEDGLKTARRILDLKDPPHIVFQTAFDDYALRAFELHAVDYLLKPVAPYRLNDSLDRLNDREASVKKVERLLSHLSSDKAYPNDNILMFLRDDSLIPVKQGEIKFAEARGKEVRVVTNKGEFIVNKSFWQFDEQLVLPEFFRCHRSYTVNLSYLERVDLWVNHSYMLKITGCDDRIPLSRSKMTDFRRLYNI